MWVIAFWVAVVAVVPVVLLENRAPWVAAVSALIGILLGIIFESKDDLRETAQAKKFAFLRQNKNGMRRPTLRQRDRLCEALQPFT